jgi:Na+/H+-dicarboxylate symporter
VVVEERRELSAWVLPLLMALGAGSGVTLGAAAGARWTDPAFEPIALMVRLLGTIFLALLKALVVPLVASSVLLSVATLGDLRTVGRAAVLTIGFFVTTTIMSVGTGLALVNLLRPGVGAADGAALGGPVLEHPPTAAQAIAEVVTGMFPPNLVAAAADGNVLGLIVFAALAGGALASMGERGRPLVTVLDAGNEMRLRLVRPVIWLAPIGIFGLVADRMGRAGGGVTVWAEFRALAWYAVTVLGGLAIHAAVTLPLILAVLGRRNPFRYAAGMGQALITAFGTASSAATMGVTLNCTTRRNGVSEEAAEFVVPLGTTINMDGTALYEAVAVLFIAQTLGVDLTIGQQIVVLLTATLAAVGAAAIPEAGLVTMVLVLGAVGLPAESVGLILSIDWILDRFRTAVNVWGDSIGAAVIDRALPSAPPDSTVP